MELDAKNTKLKPAFFLDRDGTINFDPGYINDPDIIEIIPNSAEAIHKINDADFFVFVVSNQSGIARGIIPEENIAKIHGRIDELLDQEAKAKIDEYRYCPHHPDDNCDCRKPRTKLLEQLCQDYPIDVKNSFFIGDALSDVQAGNAFNCSSILIRTGRGKDSEAKMQEAGEPKVDFVANNLLDAVNWALEKIKKRKSTRAPFSNPDAL